MFALRNDVDPHPPRSLSTYELIYVTDGPGVTTELTGSIIMICRSYATAEKLPLSEVQFWLNRTANGTSLRERTDINVLEVDKYSIRFNLTRNLEGFYTCGKCTNEDCEMSSQKQLISLQTLIPISDIPQTQSFTQDQVVLPCPIQPGALLQYYSVIWIKDSVEIAKSLNPQEVMRTDDRYSIDGSTFALIIDPVSMPGDLSEDYQCHVFVTNPITGSKQQLQHYPQLTSGMRLSLSLTVQANVGN